MIQTFIDRAIANRSSALDLADREISCERDITALDRFDEPCERRGGRAACRDARTEHEPPAALGESSGMEDASGAAAPPGGVGRGEWRAFKVALLILCVNIAAAALVATLVFKPSLALLGFFVEFCVISLTGLPMLLATVSEASERSKLKEL